jgi:hypothetical protein
MESRLEVYHVTKLEGFRHEQAGFEADKIFESRRPHLR